MHIMFSQLTQEVRIVFADLLRESMPYRIVKAEGQTVRKGNLPSGTHDYNISTNGLPEGQYRFEANNSSLQFEKRKLIGF